MTLADHLLQRQYEAHVELGSSGIPAQRVVLYDVAGNPILDTMAASLSVLDDWDESDRAKVNPIAGQAGVRQGGAGAATALTQRVAIATDAGVVDTELPAAAALSDAMANPTTPFIGAAAALFDGTDWERRYSAAGRGDAIAGLGVGAEAPYLYNESTWDRERANTGFLLAASAARTATFQSGYLTNYNANAIILNLRVTVNPGGGQTLRLKLYYGLAGVSGAYDVELAAATAHAFAGGAGNQLLVVGPGSTTTPSGGSGSAAAALPVPRGYWVECVHSGAGSWEYSIHASLVKAG